jgi:two-component system, OmpR family, sensor histidine kinase KdpD
MIDPIKRLGRGNQYLISFFLICFVSAVCFLLTDYIGYKVVAFILLVSVSILSMLFDLRPVLLAAGLSALVWNYFFIPPRFTFHVSSTEDTLMLAMYFVVALLNGTLTYKIRQLEEESRKKEERANAIKLYNVLLNSLSHELKTPIATIIGATDSMQNEDNRISNEDKQALISEISIAALRLNQQVENLLSMSRLESGYLKPKKDWCDINELIYSVINRLEDKLQSHVLSINIDDLPLFKIDRVLMEEVIYNLLLNAVIYTDPSSRINITASKTFEVKGHFNESDLHTETDQVKENLVIDIMDNGPGFPDDEIAMVFDKFYRLRKTTTGGTGLGLSIVKGFVEAHGGTVRLTNVKTGGAKFTITIPAETSSMNQRNDE